MTDPAKLRALLDEAVAALELTHKLIVACCPSGFTDNETVTRLYQNNGAIHATLARIKEQDDLSWVKFRGHDGRIF